MVEREDGSNVVSLSFYKIESENEAKEEKGEAGVPSRGARRAGRLRGVTGQSSPALTAVEGLGAP